MTLKVQSILKALNEAAIGPLDVLDILSEYLAYIAEQDAFRSLIIRKSQTSYSDCFPRKISGDSVLICFEEVVKQIFDRLNELGAAVDVLSRARQTIGLFLFGRRQFVVPIVYADIEFQLGRGQCNDVKIDINLEKRLDTFPRGVGLELAVSNFISQMREYYE